jgi:hypothetical protein
MKSAKCPKPGRPFEIMVETIRKTYNIEEAQAQWIADKAEDHGMTESKMLRWILSIIMRKEIV